MVATAVTLNDLEGHSPVAENSMIRFHMQSVEPFSTFCCAFHISVTGEDRHFKFGGRAWSGSGGQF